jgi:TRAP-type uncharacterized transport system substrate-binding protein
LAKYARLSYIGSENAARPQAIARNDMTDEDRVAALEARVEALNDTLASVLSTLVLHGVLTKPAVEQILAQVKTSAAPAGAEQVDALKQSYPAAMREAMGPPPDDDDHGH